MTLVINKHVQRIRRYQPFDVDSTEMIYELQEDREQPLYPVVTLEFLLHAIESPMVRIVVLTGDAGHGKTSLCASVLGRLRAGSEQVSTEIQREVSQDLRTTGVTADRPVGSTRAGRPLYVLSDLSAFTPGEGARKLVNLLELPDNGVAIVCANEGQLRKCVAAENASDGDDRTRLRVLVTTLTEGVERGQVRDFDGSAIVINLNYQSVAADGGNGGLVRWVLKQWNHRGKWKSCDSCDARDICPILANHRELSDNIRGPQRQEAVRDLFAAAERSGAVVTTRQALSVLSYMVTGGISCESVHAKYRWSRLDTTWQAPHLYHQSIFGDLLSQSDRHLVPAFLALRRLDPGRVSRRQVDDQLDQESAGTFGPRDPSSAPQRVRTARDAQKRAEQLRALYTFLRRLDFFDNGDRTNRFARMGLLAGDDFVRVQDKDRDPSDTKVRDRFLKGLEAVQGVHRAGSNPDFFVLDPAFFAHRAQAVVLSRRVSSKGIEVVDQTTQWQAEGARVGVVPEMHDAVEWLNRAIYIRIPAVGLNPGTVSLEADLLRFELLTRWAAGLRSEVQHEAEIRGLTGALADLADTSNGEDEIQVLVGTVMRKLMIDVGDKIRSVRA
ncbi:hypothetical protein KZX45_05915 [Georgenia sp. EYE_87]|uniref:hypothetical protein n=1 Tax=Georgenia sp. EYE_87 TaxID=2853448 RepID=UPI0020055BFE|nr:hypothetical protein [Georgenia sp. EYE_87]MCK6210076.1 hypothetical protein [Georgenia sp. EYE_87]